MGWGWAGVIWLYSLVTYIPLDILKFGIRYAHSGKAWDTLLENKVRFFSFIYYRRILSYEIVDLNLWAVCDCIIDCLHNQKGLWQRRERSTVGGCTEDSTWSTTT